MPFVSRVGHYAGTPDLFLRSAIGHLTLTSNPPDSWQEDLRVHDPFVAGSNMRIWNSFNIADRTSVVDTFGGG